MTTIPLVIVRDKKTDTYLTESEGIGFAPEFPGVGRPDQVWPRAIIEKSTLTTGTKLTDTAFLEIIDLNLDEDHYKWLSRKWLNRRSYHNGLKNLEIPSLSK